jgi:hypothetical protein
VFLLYVNVVLAILIAIGALGFLRSRSPQGVARGLAKALLRAYGTAKQSNPAASSRELYQMALQTRDGYVPGTVAELISDAAANAHAANMYFNFRLVVIEMATEEFVVRTSNSATRDLRDISFGVYSVIRDDF